MSKKRYVVELTSEERAILNDIVTTEERVARHKRRRATILLKVDEGEHGPAWTDAKAAEAFNARINTVVAARRQLVLEGLDRAIHFQRPPKPPRTPIFDATKESDLLAVAASESPKGHARWTLRLLADAVVRLDIVDAVCRETVRRTLEKTTCTLIAKSRG